MAYFLGNLPTSRTNNSRIFGITNAKFSRYCFYTNTNLKENFQICISVPLSEKVTLESFQLWLSLGSLILTNLITYWSRREYKKIFQTILVLIIKCTFQYFTAGSFRHKQSSTWYPVRVVKPLKTDNLRKLGIITKTTKKNSVEDTNINCLISSG